MAANQLLSSAARPAFLKKRLEPDPEGFSEVPQRHDGGVPLA